MNDLEDEIRKVTQKRTGTKLRQGRNAKKDFQNQFIKFLNVEAGSEYTEIIFYSRLRPLADLGGHESRWRAEAPVPDATIPLPVTPFHTAPGLMVGHTEVTQAGEEASRPRLSEVSDFKDKLSRNSTHY